MADNHSGTRDDDAGNAEAEEQLAEALAAAERAPDDDAAWERLERLAEDLERPDEVGALYRKLLAQDLERELADSLGRRAAQFHEEWFSEDSEHLAEVLRRVLDLDPTSEWALQRVTVVMTVGERWSELLGLYDRALAATRDAARREQLLDEAASLAKDFAGAPDRAIDYLSQLLELRPSDAQLASSLERLLERQARWQELIALWRKRLEGAAPKDALALRERIATCYLDDLGDAGACLAEVRALLGDGAAPERSLALLERIVALDSASPQVRQGALDILREHYEALGRKADVIRIVGVALALSTGEERIARHRELGARMAAEGDVASAMTHWAAVLTLDPAAEDAQQQLADLAASADAYDRYAQALVEAAEATPPGPRHFALLVEAGDVRSTKLGDRDGAIELYRRVLDADARPQSKVTVARRLETLLDAAGRHGDRLAVLEDLAQLETDPVERRRVLGQCARLADKVGDADRALGFWGQRLQADATDLEALDAMIELTEREARWDLHVEALARRVAADVPPVQRRLDLARIATTQAAKLGETDAAIDTWSRIVQQFGESHETVDALFELLARAGRFDELHEMLGRAADRDASRAGEVLARVGDVCLAHLGRLDEAAKAYHRAVQMVPDLPRALDGLRALLDRPESRASAVRGLAKAYELTDAWQATLELLEPRLELAWNDDERVELLREAAVLHETRGHDASAAFDAIRRALGYAPASAELEAELLRLAEATERWADATEAVARAAEALAPIKRDRAAELRRREGALRETRLHDPAGAHEAWLAALSLSPHDLAIAAEAIRTGAVAARWDGAARALVEVSAARAEVPADLLASLESHAEQSGAFAALAVGLAASIPAPGETTPEVGRVLERKVAAWHREHTGDADAAEAALRRALAHDRGHTETLRELARVASRTPDRRLVDTLLELAAHFPDDLDPLYDAARIALDAIGDSALATSILERLLRSARRLWEGGAAATGERQPDTTAQWAHGELVRLALEADQHERAVNLLVDGARMPVSAHESRAMRRQAGELCRDTLGDEDRALRLFQSVIDESVEDAQAVAQLGALLEQRGRLPELLALRQRQLELDLDPDTRLAVRLEVARVLGLIEAQGGRIGALRANLAERPGHEPSIEGLAAILSTHGRSKELAELFAAQASAVEQQGDAARAAGLWSRAAVLLETELRDIDAALKAYRRVVALRHDAAALDALARLHLGRGESAVAAEWLQRRFDAAHEAERNALALRLAEAHLAAGHTESAMAALERVLANDPTASDARSRLATLYRDAGAWEPLARLLAEGAPHEPDESTRLAYVREAASLYETKLGQPERAIPVLRMGIQLAPDDAELKSKLALGLRVAGRLDEARAILEELAHSFGRRRSPERARVHFQLAQVAHAAGNLDEAMDQLEQARKMDMSHPGILRMAGQMAREAGQLERAEKNYRALLLVVRRQDPGAPDVTVGASEVLYELSLLATEQNDSAQAAELLESALSTAAQHDAELERLSRELLARGESELALRAVDMRLAAVETPESEARVLARRAEVLEQLGRDDEALQAALRALVLSPRDAALHDRCRALAKRSGGVKRYADTLAELTAKLRRKEEAADASDLLLRLGDVTENDLGDLDGAAALYAKVEELGVRVADAWRALARIAARRGDGAEEARVLRRLATTEDAHIPSDARTQALYRIAEIELAAGRIDEGIETLQRALDREPRHARATAILRSAIEHAPESRRLFALYEEVARASGDSATILDLLERQAARPDGTLAQVKEGVERADLLSAPERAEALLRRGLEIARASEGGLRDALWVPIALAERREAAGDLTSAIAYLRAAAEATDGDEAVSLHLRVAALASQPGGDLRLAAETYRHLLATDPSNRSLWEPLAAAYASLGDRESLEEVVRATLDALLDPSDRNELRMLHARFLLDVAKAGTDAIAVLEQVLDEDPDHVEAAQRLADLVEASGDTQKLVELLHRQLDRARDRQDVDAIAALALRMGKLVEAEDPHAAMDHYRAGLDWAPEHRELLEALLALEGAEQEQRERAEMAERLLSVTTGPEAVRIANDLIELYTSLNDPYGIARALDLGFKACPSDASLRERLEAYHREREDWDELAAMIRYDAAHREDAAEAIARYREAAALVRPASPARAAEILREAWNRVPTELALLEELVRDLDEASLPSEAIADVGAALERHPAPGPERAQLLRMRARLALALGDTPAAVGDLEEAYVIDPTAAQELAAGLDAQREAAARAGDTESERVATHRLAVVLRDAGEHARSRDVLAEWVERAPHDREALRILHDVDAQAERWEDVVRHLARLVEIEEGEEQVTAALRLAEACDKLGTPDAARAGLELAVSAQPGEGRLRAALEDLYERTGAYRELAQMLRDDAASAPEEEQRFQLFRRAGELLVAIGDPEAALEPLMQAVALRPEDHDLVVALSDAYMGSGRLQEAVELLQEAINGFKKRRSPVLAAMQLRMSRIAGISGDPETQKEWLSVALESDKNNGEIASELAELAIALGDDETALKALRVVTLLKTPGPMSKAVAFLRQAQIAQRQGDSQKAVLWARRARMEDETLVEAQELLQQIGES